MARSGSREATKVLRLGAALAFSLAALPACADPRWAPGSALASLGAPHEAAQARPKRPAIAATAAAKTNGFTASEPRNLPGFESVPNSDAPWPSANESEPRSQTEILGKI